MSIRHKLLSLIIFIKFWKCIMVFNICRVTFIEISERKFALLARLWHRKGRIYGSESNMRHGGNVWNLNLFPKRIKIKSKTLPQIWYNTPPILKPKSWKLVIQWHGNASFSHMIFLDFDPWRLWKLYYRVIHHIWLLQNHPTNRISLIQIWYKTTSRLKPKSMKTSDTMAWDASFQHRSFLQFELNSIWEWKYKVLNNIWLPQHHKTHIKFLIQIW